MPQKRLLFILTQFQLSTFIQPLICKAHSFWFTQSGIHSVVVISWKKKKKESIMWINLEITHAGLWMIFCTWISYSGETDVDLSSIWKNLAHGRGGNKKKKTANIAFHYCSHMRLFPSYILWTALTRLLPRMWNKAKPFNQSLSSTGHFICMRWLGGGQVYLKGTQSWRGQGDAVQGLLY